MPKYSLPPLGDQNDSMPEVAKDDYDDSYPQKWDRTITIPVNAEILENLEVGGDVEVTLMGKVEELSDVQSEGDRGRTSITVVISEVKAYPENGEAAMDKGFKRKHNSHNSHGY